MSLHRPRNRPRSLSLASALVGVGLLALLGVTGAAQSPPPTAAGAAPAPKPLRIFLDRPDPFEPAFGEVEMEATVVADIAVERVVFYLDGIVVGERTEPPWMLTVAVGSENAEHDFEVVVHGEGGVTDSAATTTPAIRVDDEVKISLQQLYVTVTDRDSGERVLSLQPEDFEILDEGRPQELVTFARGDIPFTSVVLLDSSVSMEGSKLRAAVQGAGAFFAGMVGLDEGKLSVFSDRILHSTPFTTVPQVLTTGLSGIRARGGTAVADHLYLALQQVEARQGRRVVVLLSDGVDSHSVLRMERVLERARRSQALIYWLQLPYREGSEAAELPNLRGFWRTPEEYRQELETLRRVVEESAGRVLVLRTVDDIEPAFREILRELREQYVLGYYPNGARHDGSFRHVRVRVERAGTDVRCQSGYLDL